jgi:hypothetical protein
VPRVNSASASPRVDRRSSIIVSQALGQKCVRWLAERNTEEMAVL